MACTNRTARTRYSLGPLASATAPTVGPPMRIVASTISGPQRVADVVFGVNGGRPNMQVFNPGLDVQGDPDLLNATDCAFQDAMRNFVGSLVMGTQGPPLLQPNHVLTLRLRLPAPADRTKNERTKNGRPG